MKSSTQMAENQKWDVRILRIIENSKICFFDFEWAETENKYLLFWVFFTINIAYKQFIQLCDQQIQAKKVKNSDC